MPEISGNIVDLVSRKIFTGTLNIQNGVIVSIVEFSSPQTNFIIPGFVDSHVHIESSLVIPSTFANIALKHGVIAAVCDPHEIANVCGVEGIKFMVENSKSTQFQFFYGAPSCVPATTLESSGAIISSDEIEQLFRENVCSHLSEMMNFPGVIYDDTEVLRKLNVAKKYGKKIDGHAPTLSGEALKKYISAGIDTDHECSTIEEAIEKIHLGMKILIREGSAAKNLEALKELFNLYPDRLMLCTDDCHVDNLLQGYINEIVKGLLKDGYNLFDVLSASSLIPITHYNLPIGLLQINDSADFNEVNNLIDLEILDVYVKGGRVESQGSIAPATPINNFRASKIAINDLKVESSKGTYNIIEALDKELITLHNTFYFNGLSDINSSYLQFGLNKIAVMDRYSSDSIPFVGFIRGFDLRSGAFASSIAHDNHNIIAIGSNDRDLCDALNSIIGSNGGISFSQVGHTNLLALPIGGLMSLSPAEWVSEKYNSIQNDIKAAGCSLTSPLMTLAFMALIVIPQLKISHKGLFDFTAFNYIPLIKK